MLKFEINCTHQQVLCFGGDNRSPSDTAAFVPDKNTAVLSLIPAP